ncbi:MAG: hypothetical protein ACRED5_02345 [Propylenella sp.]
MTKLRSIAAAITLTAALAASASASAAAEKPARGISAIQAAVFACMSFNREARSLALTAVEDGIGDWLVWLRDANGGLRLCNASAEGNIYVNAAIRGDVLQGAGERAIELAPVATPAAATVDPAEKAERVCAAASRKIGGARIVATVGDGVGDYLIWLEDSGGSYWACNASADAKLWVFEPARAPLNNGTARAGFRTA